MSDAARTTGQLAGRLRSVFSSGPQANLSAMSQVVIDMPESTAAATTVVNDKLTLFDQALTEAETHLAQQVAAAPSPLSTDEPQLVDIQLATPAVQPTPEATIEPTPELIPEPAPLTAEGQPTTELVSAPDLTAMAPAMPAMVAQATDTLNPQFAYGAAKEKLEVGVHFPSGEDPAGLQHVEQEVAPEISPEVAEYLQEAENHAEQLPQEIVIAADQSAIVQSHFPKQPVIVLPITPEIESAGERKSTAFSIRWLVEFSRKVMKMFTGKVVYRQVEAPASSS